MKILENMEVWSEAYRRGWLKHLQETGEVDWSRYQHPRNQLAPGAPGIDLSKSRLILISSAGAHRRVGQQPFDTSDLLGDYSIRTFPSLTSFDELAFAHDNYDRAMVEADTGVALPLRLLEELVGAGQLGALTPSVVSFMGYQPDSARVVDETVPQIVDVALAEGASGALLAPV